MLEGSTVIVTSRPNASGDLHDLVSLRIEILGFTQEELRDYFSDCLDGDKEAVSRLIELAYWSTSTRSILEKVYLLLSSVFSHC